MPRRRRENEKSEGRDRWLITYADLITLLMIFFIILYTMAKVDKSKFNVMAQSLKRAINKDEISATNGIMPLNTGINPVLIYNKLKTDNEIKKMNAKIGAAQRLKETIDKTMKGTALANEVRVLIQERGVVIRISSKILFDVGSAEISEVSKPNLKNIGDLLSNLDNQMRIEGFTDSQPINNDKYPTNWELSGARAMSVLRFLRDNCDVPPARLAATGYGEFRPINPGNMNRDRPEDRRVDIVIVGAENEVKENPVQN